MHLSLHGLQNTYEIHQTIKTLADVLLDRAFTALGNWISYVLLQTVHKLQRRLPVILCLFYEITSLKMLNTRKSWVCFSL